LTRNFQSLVLHVCGLLEAARGGAPSLAAANALHLAGVMLKLISEMAAPSTLVAVFDSGPDPPAAAKGARAACV
jgi:hypothetical protein